MLYYLQIYFLTKQKTRSSIKNTDTIYRKQQGHSFHQPTQYVFRKWEFGHRQKVASLEFLCIFQNQFDQFF